MPFLDVNGTRLYYEDTGGSGEPIVFSHGLLWSGRMFDKQVAALKDRYRCITYDHRGQGQSDVWKVDAVDIETLFADAVGLIEKLGVGPCHFVGLSMGGFVGMRLAARRPDLLRSLVLMETSADPEPAENVPKYKGLNFIARWIGLGLAAAPVRWAHLDGGGAGVGESAADGLPGGSVLGQAAGELSRDLGPSPAWERGGAGAWEC